MFKNLYDRLLTNYPLLWNTRVIWVLALAFAFHLLFFISGFGSLSLKTLQEYSSLDSVQGGDVITFSFLCSLAILITWLVFFLRNNAFKSFFIVDRFHLVKEFVIIFIIILISITFFESYRLGAKIKVKSLTSQRQLVREANIVNIARAFIPLSKADYFKLNSCYNYQTALHYNEGFDYSDTSHYSYAETNNIKIRAALALPDAFSYKNFCRTAINLDEYPGFVKDSDWIRRRDAWIDNRQIDSIQRLLDQFIVIADRYNVSHDLNTATLAQLVFADSSHSITRVYRNSAMDYTDATENSEYINLYQFERALDLVDESHLDNQDTRDHLGTLVAEAYVAICLSILLLCFRLYTKKVFLISILGSIIWAIIFSLVAMSSRSPMSTGWFYLSLFILFLFLSLLFLRSQAGRTATGIVLNWHIYLLPFVVMILCLLIIDYYDSNIYELQYNNGTNIMLSDAERRERFPIGYWINNNVDLLFRLNLLFVFLYTAFFFTHLSKKWHIMPEE